MGCNQGSPISTEQRVCPIFGNQFLVKLDRGGIIALIVVDNDLYGNLLAVFFDQDAPAIIDLFDRQLVAFLEVAPFAGLPPGHGQGCAQNDLLGLGHGLCRGEGKESENKK